MPLDPTRKMQSHRRPVGLAQINGCESDELRRRVEGCRDRLRRIRAARRITERTAPGIVEDAEEVLTVNVSPAIEAREENG